MNKPRSANGRRSGSQPEKMSSTLIRGNMSIHTFIEIAEHAFWKGQKEQELFRTMKPGEFYLNLPEVVQEKLKDLKSADFNNVQFDAISFMCDNI